MKKILIILSLVAMCSTSVFPVMEAINRPSYSNARLATDGYIYNKESDIYLPDTASIEEETRKEEVKKNIVIESDSDIDILDTLNETTKPVEVEEPIETETKVETTGVYSVRYDKEFLAYVKAISKEYGFDYRIIFAIIERESSWHPTSISGSQCYGLMQISIHNHAKWEAKYGKIDWLDPYQNVRIGVEMLASYGCDDIRHSIMCYSMGVGAANRLWASGVHDTWYTKDILERMYKF